MDRRWVLSGAARAAAAVIRQHRWRSAATLAVCGLGTAGVIVAGAIGQAQVAEMQRRLDAVGGRLLVVSPNTVTPYPGRPRQLEHFISLEPDDVDAIRREIGSVEAIVPVVAGDSTLRLANNAARVRLVGTVAGYAQLRRFGTARGRFLTDADQGERVVVLGHAVSRELHPEGGVRPGEIVWLGGQPYEAVGILQPFGVNFAGEDEDRQAFIPLETYRRRVANRLWLSHLYLQLRPETDSAVTARQVVGVLRARHDRVDGQIDDVIARDMAEAAVQQSRLSATAVWIISLTSGLLLVLGLVGIATLMVQTVRQRTGEIGLRRAVGATPVDVAVQLFLEAMILASAGVVGGAIVGTTGALVGQVLWGTLLTIDASLLLLTAVTSLVISGVACLVPALMAARIEPAAALRL
jgi:putative ABC transport system permease protein